MKDRKENHIYTGLPAKDVTERMGYQFDENLLEKRKNIFLGYLKEYKKNRE